MQHPFDRRPTAPQIRFWLAEKKEELRRAWFGGETIATLCQRLGISVSSARRIARIEGWPDRKRGVRPTVRSAAEIQRIVAAYRPAIVSQKEIATRFHIGTQTLRSLLRAAEEQGDGNGTR